MTRSEFDAFCGALHGTTHVEQWGNASVWKIGGKIFAICSAWGAGSETRISFKCSDLAYDILIDQPGIIPAPYLARAKWVQVASADAMSDEDLRDYIRSAYSIVMAKLTKAQRKELGLTTPTA
ncbi:MAG: MmcQ/YjbR family DNA-binding protein [Inquilinus sp.]|nr:MmcQ/YjbR family DNA-binding protein [Inquilinus sp.]